MSVARPSREVAQRGANLARALNGWASIPVELREAACPWCNSPAGQACVIAATNRALVHVPAHYARYRAAGIEPPLPRIGPVGRGDRPGCPSAPPGRHGDGLKHAGCPSVTPTPPGPSQARTAHPDRGDPMTPDHPTDDEPCGACGHIGACADDGRRCGCMFPHGGPTALDLDAIEAYPGCPACSGTILRLVAALRAERAAVARVRARFVGHDSLCDTEMDGAEDACVCGYSDVHAALAGEGR